MDTPEFLVAEYTPADLIAHALRQRETPLF